MRGDHCAVLPVRPGGVHAIDEPEQVRCLSAQKFPRLPILGPLVCAACSVGLAWLAGVRRVSGVLMAGGATMLLPSVTMVLLASARDGLLNFYFATYALPSTISGGLGLALWVDGQDRSGTATDGLTETGSPAVNAVRRDRVQLTSCGARSDSSADWALRRADAIRCEASRGCGRRAHPAPTARPTQ